MKPPLTNYHIRLFVRMEWPEGMTLQQALEWAADEQWKIGGEVDEQRAREDNDSDEASSVDVVVYIDKQAEDEYAAVVAAQVEQEREIGATVLDQPVVVWEQPVAEEDDV